MGSIVAILSRSCPADSASAFRMFAAAPHRGKEVTLRACGNALLGISNSADHVDSALSAEGEFSAVFTGKLDNALELAKDLAAAGFPSLSTNSADIAVSAFRAFGDEAPSRLRGVFAGVVTDGHRMWCFRDHLGFQPLFYRDEPRGFFVATEAKQVIAGAGIQREPDMEVLEWIFYGRMRRDSPSVFKGVSRLPHATTLSVNGKGTSAPRSYWYPQKVLETARISSLGEVKEKFDELFAQAVARCLTGEDVVSLSGGVDSPAVAGYAAPLHRQQTGEALSALSLVFPDHPAVDESSYIQQVTEFLGMRLYTRTPKVRILDDLAQWCQVLDGPIPSMSAPQMHEYYLEARQLGFRNILTGDIAECIADLPRHAAGHLLVNRRWQPLLRLIATQRSQGKSRRDIASQLLLPFIPGRVANWCLSTWDLDSPERMPRWLNDRKVNEVPFRNDLVPRGRDRWLALQTLPLEGCPITMEGGEMCAALAGVTVRRPFADIDLWEFFLSLPAEIKYPDLRSKTLIRQLLRGRVPDVILDRRKKTYFDDHVLSQVDYTVLSQYLSKPEYQIAGVDYGLLEQRLKKRDLGLIEWIWVNDLVRIHAFLSQW
jgi:asparagine synthase (glutamine-hydrolysing)